MEPYAKAEAASSAIIETFTKSIIWAAAGHEHGIIFPKVLTSPKGASIQLRMRPRITENLGERGWTRLLDITPKDLSAIMECLEYSIPGFAIEVKVSNQVLRGWVLGVNEPGVYRWHEACRNIELLAGKRNRKVEAAVKNARRERLAEAA